MRWPLPTQHGVATTGSSKHERRRYDRPKADPIRLAIGGASLRYGAEPTSPPPVSPSLRQTQLPTRPSPTPERPEVCLQGPSGDLGPTKIP